MAWESVALWCQRVRRFACSSGLRCSAENMGARLQELFDQERELLGRVPVHPNIVRLLGYVNVTLCQPE